MKILIAMLVTPSTDKKLLSEAIKSILPFKPLVEIHLYKGAKAMWEVPPQRTAHHQAFPSYTRHA